MEVPSLITDLAVMLMTAAVVTIIFKKIKQPLILGYIVAGFLISSYFPLFFDVENMESIHTWSEIGVVFLLFHIGLHFDIKKLAELGSTAIVSASVKMAGVLVMGWLMGRLYGLNTINSLFLGAMLSISSTVVIQKSFEELHVQDQPYTGLVMGSLVVEDILGIFLMVVLSTLSASQTVNGPELLKELAMMLIYLVAWLLLGIYILPTVLNRIMDLMSDEMLAVLSIGLCFSMALLASRLGFSMELGAFIAGSLMAGTVHAEDVSRVTSGIKDLFGAIFFLSVGMMVDPSVIASNWKSIVPIALLAIVFKLIFATAGMVMSGQELSTAVKGGTSLAPIGEFSFIIASLGISLGVMEKALYPTIVAASILTMILTPSLIRNSDREVDLLMKIIPDSLLALIQEYTSGNQASDDRDPDWTTVLKSFFSKVLIYGTLLLVIAMAGTQFLYPAADRILPAIPAAIISFVVIYGVMIIFIRPLLDFHSPSFTNLWFSRMANRPPLVTMIVIKFAFIAAIAYIPVRGIFGSHQWVFLATVILAIVVVGRSDFVSTFYLQLETRFLRNLNERTIEQEEKLAGPGHWLDEDYSIVSFIVPADAPYVGRNLEDLSWGRNLNIYVVKIERKKEVERDRGRDSGALGGLGRRAILMPSGSTHLYAGDKVYIVGDYQSIDTFYSALGFQRTKPIRTLKTFMESDYPDTASALACIAVKVNGNAPFCGKTIRKSGIQQKRHCMILGIRKNGYTVTMPDANMLIEENDIMWLIGSNNNVGIMAAAAMKSRKS